MNIPGNYNGCMVFFKEMKIRYNSDLIFEKNGGVLNFTLILAIVFPSPKYHVMLCMISIINNRIQEMSMSY